MIVTAFPRSVRVIEHTLVPLNVGTTLAARIWLPDDAERATARSSCCREVYARGKPRAKSVVANGIALFPETSYEK